MMEFKTINECLALEDKAKCNTQGSIAGAYEPKQITGSGKFGDYAFWTQTIKVRDASGQTLINIKIPSADAKAVPGQYFIGTNLSVNLYNEKKSLRGDGLVIDLPGASKGSKKPDMRDLSIARMNAVNRICELYTIIDEHKPMFSKATLPALMEEICKEADHLVDYFFTGINTEAEDGPEPDMGPIEPPVDDDKGTVEKTPPAASEKPQQAADKPDWGI